MPIVNELHAALLLYCSAALPLFNSFRYAAGGYAHIVEDVNKFPASFGADVVAGLCDNPTIAFGRKQRRLNLGQERQMVQSFLKMFQPFDWTAKLEGGSY